MAEPEWDQETRSLALGLDSLDVCPICGGLAAECMAPEHQDDWVAEDPIRCHRETARLFKQKGYSEEANPAVAALAWPVHLRERGA